jgi:phosphopantetheinyl transferase
VTSEVLVRWADTSGWPPDATAGLLGAAEPATRDRVNRLHRSDDRITVLAAHLLARSTAGRRTADVSLRHVCPQCGGTDHGRPSLHAGDRRLPVSISHTRTLAVVALSPGGEIGVDVEAAGEVPLTDELFTAAEQAAARADPTGRTGRDIWAAKEALGKLDGRGILAPLAEVEVHTGTVRRLTESAPTGWIRDIALPRTASVAIAYDAPVAVRVEAVDLPTLMSFTGREP